MTLLQYVATEETNYPCGYALRLGHSIHIFKEVQKDSYILGAELNKCFNVSLIEVLSFKVSNSSARVLPKLSAVIGSFHS